MTHDITINLTGLNVMIGIPAGRDLPAMTVKSLIGTFDLCRSRGVPCQLGMVAGSAVVQWARDEVADLFLQSDATRLFWIDSDMVWKPEDFMRMLALSQYRDVICAAYPAKREQPTFFLKYGELVHDEYGLVEIEGIGLGFSVVSRKVMRQLADKAKKVRDQITDKEMSSIFRVDSTDGNRRGEDMAFFADILALGHKVWLDPAVDLGHIGQKTYTGTIRDALV